MSRPNSIRSDLPLMIWDSECAWCRRWIQRWQRITGEQVQYAPYQYFDLDENNQLKKFPSISIHDCERAVQLVLPDGSVYRAAEAVFRALAAAGRRNVWLWLYQHCPGFQFISERLYTFIASRRPLFQKI